jgi:Cation efflux system protein CusB domain 1
MSQPHPKDASPRSTPPLLLFFLGLLIGGGLATGIFLLLLYEQRNRYEAKIAVLRQPPGPVKGLNGLTASMSGHQIEDRLRRATPEQLSALLQEFPVEVQAFDRVTKGDVTYDIFAPGEVEAAEPDRDSSNVTCRVQEAVIARVRPGQQATVRFNAVPGRQFAGTVKGVGAQPLDPGVAARPPQKHVKVYPVTVALTEKAPKLEAGAGAEVTLHAGSKKDVLRLPAASVVGEPPRLLCYVKTAGGIEQRGVVIGFTGDQLVEVVAGVREGELVLRLSEVAQRMHRWLNGNPPDQPDEDVKGGKGRLP